MAQFVIEDYIQALNMLICHLLLRLARMDMDSTRQNWPHFSKHHFKTELT